MRRRWLLLSVLLVSAHSALAHNVVGVLFVEAGEISGEVGFSNGDLATEGGDVRLQDAEGALIAQTQTDEYGTFSFAYDAQMPRAAQVQVNLGAGHQIVLPIAAEDLVLPTPTPETTDNPSAVADFSQLETLVAKAVAHEIKPLRRQLLAFQERATVQDIIGGLGVIFGLVGFASAYYSRRAPRKKDVNAQTQ